MSGRRPRPSARATATASLSRLPVASVAGCLRLDPGATLATHTELRRDDVLRAHVALVSPPKEATRWPIGRARLLDVRAPHGAKDPREAPRLTFIVDLRVGLGPERLGGRKRAKVGP